MWLQIVIKAMTKKTKDGYEVDKRLAKQINLMPVHNFLNEFV